MKVLLAVGNTKIQANLLKGENQQKILISYAYFKSTEEYLKIFENWWPKFLMLDSGAFTVWTKGSTINLDDYADYCKEMRITAPETTEIINVNLDVLPGKFGETPTAEQRIESAEAGLKNCEYLWNKEVKAIPVFHMHEPFHFLERMKKDYEYFGISPANDVHIKEKEKWLKKVFSIIKADRKTHGFGCTAISLLKQFPFYSADSTSWNAGARFARTPNFQTSKIANVVFKDKNSFLKNWENLNIKSMEQLTSYTIRGQEGIKSFQQLEKFITDLWSNRNIIWTN